MLSLFIYKQFAYFCLISSLTQELLIFLTFRYILFLLCIFIFCFRMLKIFLSSFLTSNIVHEKSSVALNLISLWPICFVPSRIYQDNLSPSHSKNVTTILVSDNTVAGNRWHTQKNKGREFNERSICKGYELV